MWGFLVLLILVVLYWRIFLSPKQKPVARRVVTPPPRMKEKTQPAQNNPPPPPVVNLPLGREVHGLLDGFKLLTLEDSDQDTMIGMQDVILSIPRPHPMIRSLLDSNNSEDLYKLVKSDAFIAAKVLQKINSGHFYLHKKITRLSHAILYLGSNTVKNIAVQCLMSTNPAVKDKNLKQALEKVWAHGFLASSLAYIFAKHLQLPNASELGTQALLSYIGNLAILYYEPTLASSFEKDVMLIERIELEQQTLQTNAALVGGQLAREWQLPEEIIESISDSFMPLVTPKSKCYLEGKYLRNLIVCYVSCRVGELILEQDMDDISQLDFLDEELIELYYLPNYFHDTGLTKIVTLVTQPTFQNEANKLIKQLGNAA